MNATKIKAKLRKIQENIEALRDLVTDTRKQNVLDEMEEQLAFLRDEHPSQP